VAGVVCVAGLAPFQAAGLDWFEGMATASATQLHASCEGRGALENYLLAAEFDPEMFTQADHAALSGAWSWLGATAAQAMLGGIDGTVDDDLAFVNPWGFEPMQVSLPVLFLHGVDDRVVPSAHSQWLAHRLPSAELWLRPAAGHISVLHDGVSALEWLARSCAHR
jgi:pimeloyl-ACP methyl ester carboxylesterase